MFRKILVPLDGSSLAEKALPVAEEEAKAYGASIVLLRVVHPNFFDKPFSKAEKTLIEKYKEQANKYLAMVAERVRNEAAVNVRAEVGEGDPAKVILDVAEVQKSSLIAMTTHGFSGLRHITLGSVASKVAKAAKARDIPLLLIRTTPLTVAVMEAEAEVAPNVQKE